MAVAAHFFILVVYEECFLIQPFLFKHLSASRTFTVERSVSQSIFEDSYF